MRYVGHNYFKRRDFKVSYLKLGECKSLGGKVVFFQLPWDNKNFNNFKFSVFIHVVLLINYLEQFELCFYFQYSIIYEVL